MARKNHYSAGHDSVLDGELLDAIEKVTASYGVVMSVSFKSSVIVISDPQ